MFQMVSQVPLESIRIGDRVISATGRHGKVSEIVPQGTGSALEDTFITIQWFATAEAKESWSDQYHYALNKVVYIGR